jgi:hypothetical protein
MNINQNSMRSGEAILPYLCTPLRLVFNGVLIYTIGP